jgi:hypothetical protein
MLGQHLSQVQVNEVCRKAPQQAEPGSRTNPRLVTSIVTPVLCYVYVPSVLLGSVHTL